MTLLIPTNSNNRHECIISSIEENSSWAYITLNDGQIISCDFFDRKEDIIEWIDYVVVINDKEFIWTFIDEKTKVLIVENQKSIDEIIESFLLNNLSEFTPKL
ncbi:MAG: hypothetical protein C0626_04090 [Arcobacter sp.]|uniref:hypothetical protein n=1 Tax=uncultured Arcobacter sp. TaxID=165434 RepID=UPI000CC500D8|nr:hypothetical protein [uncultured Arcobacter sp.]PLY10820.1 MAG: hypothetical protein C0626_04090 [Arcobacter sp.]